MTDIDIDKLQELTAARKKTWLDLHCAIGAYNAAKEFTERCRKAMDAAANADEAADSALHGYLREQSDKPPSTTPGA